MKIQNIILLVMILLFGTSGLALAQVTSNRVETRVGNPAQDSRAEGDTVCPIPGGKVTCGPSRPSGTSYPACSVGHCAGPEYCPGGVCPSWCTAYPATAYAADIPAAPYQNVLMPEITFPGDSRTHPLTCSFVGQSPSTYNRYQVTPMYSCTDDTTGKLVWVQFSHVLAGSAKTGQVKSGQPIGQVDPDNQPNVGGGFPHTHIQIGINGACTGNDPSGCVGADKYLQCR